MSNSNEDLPKNDGANGKSEDRIDPSKPWWTPVIELLAPKSLLDEEFGKLNQQYPDLAKHLIRRNKNKGRQEWQSAPFLWELWRHSSKIKKISDLFEAEFSVLNISAPGSKSSTTSNWIKGVFFAHPEAVRSCVHLLVSYGAKNWLELCPSVRHMFEVSADLYWNGNQSTTLAPADRVWTALNLRTLTSAREPATPRDSTRQSKLTLPLSKSLIQSQRMLQLINNDQGALSINGIDHLESVTNSNFLPLLINASASVDEIMDEVRRLIQQARSTKPKAIIRERAPIARGWLRWLDSPIYPDPPPPEELLDIVLSEECVDEVGTEPKSPRVDKDSIIQLATADEGTWMCMSMCRMNPFIFDPHKDWRMTLNRWQKLGSSLSSGKQHHVNRLAAEFPLIRVNWSRCPK